MIIEDIKYLRLSSAFGNMKVEPSLECTAKMLNINYGHNRELMNKCKMLSEYARFVDLVREYTKGITDENQYKKAAKRAVEMAISSGILADILSRNKSEVMEMLLDAERDLMIHIKCEKKESFEEGLELGHLQTLITVVLKKYSRGKSVAEAADELEMSEAEVAEYYELIKTNPEATVDELIDLIISK